VKVGPNVVFMGPLRTMQGEGLSLQTDLRSRGLLGGIIASLKNSPINQYLKNIGAWLQGQEARVTRESADRTEEVERSYAGKDEHV
jgi:hypothetical protein